MQEPRILPLGDAAYTIEFGKSIDQETYERVQGFASAVCGMVQNRMLMGVVECIPAFCSATVHLAPDCEEDIPDLLQKLLNLARSGVKTIAAGSHWRIPVCFEPDYAPDLEEISHIKNIACNEAIALLTGTAFSVYMIGFLPGFPYLGVVPDRLALPRRASPRKAVPAGSIAIAGQMCAIYPCESPGGWWLAGRTPLRLFEAANQYRPSLLIAGDKVWLHSVEADVYETIKVEVNRGVVDLSNYKE